MSKRDVFHVSPDGRVAWRERQTILGNGQVGQSAHVDGRLDGQAIGNEQLKKLIRPLGYG